jgi:PKD repeat protein
MGTWYWGEDKSFPSPATICAVYGSTPEPTWSDILQLQYLSTDTGLGNFSPYYLNAKTLNPYSTSSPYIMPQTYGVPVGNTSGRFIVPAALCVDLGFHAYQIWNISVGSPPVNPLPNASFVATPASGTTPFTVTLTDTSTESPTSWLWNVTTPTHLELSPASTAVSSFNASEVGTYTILLTVTNLYGVNSTSQQVVARSPDGAVPDGYTRTVVFVTDGGTGGIIVGATLNLRDVQNNTWKNGTSTALGTTFVSISGHTIDIYGSYPGVYTSSYELDAVAGGNYYLPLMPPVPSPPGGLTGGYVNLFVNVFDMATNNIIQHASVTAKLPTGATTGENTGTTGTVLFLVPNNTVIIIGASASGYQSISQSTTSGTGADKIVNVKLIRQTITVAPVVTDPGTGAIITAVPTVDSRTTNQKDVDMMNLLRDNGDTIISLAILAIIFGLLKMIMKF